MHMLTYQLVIPPTATNLGVLAYMAFPGCSWIAEDVVDPSHLD